MNAKDTSRMPRVHSRRTFTILKAQILLPYADPRPSLLFCPCVSAAATAVLSATREERLALRLPLVWLM